MYALHCMDQQNINTQIVLLATNITTLLLLIISEYLPYSKCKSNSITQFIQNLIECLQACKNPDPVIVDVPK